jgi:cytochrome c oxidase subunit 3
MNTPLSPAAGTESPVATDTDPRPAIQFETLHQQREASLFGMWIFLATELMIFGGLLTAYIIYRAAYPAEFGEASKHLNLLIGGINTIVLLTSSLTMALAVRAAQTGLQKRTVWLLLLTAALGAAFMGLKAVEYYSDYKENLMPGVAFQPKEWSEKVTEPDHVHLSPDHVQLFLILYYFMTILHAIHLTVGIVLLLIIARLASRGRYSPANYGGVEISGLYWHFIDIVWIFLLPLLYLISTRTSWQ